MQSKINRRQGNVKIIKYESFEDLMQYVIETAEWAPFTISHMYNLPHIGFAYKNNEYHCVVERRLGQDDLLDEHIDKIKIMDQALWEYRDSPKEVIKEKYLKMYNDYFVVCDILT